MITKNEKIFTVTRRMIGPYGIHICWQFASGSLLAVMIPETSIQFLHIVVCLRTYYLYFIDLFYVCWIFNFINLFYIEGQFDLWFIIEYFLFHIILLVFLKMYDLLHRCKKPQYLIEHFKTLLSPLLVSWWRMLLLIILSTLVWHASILTSSFHYVHSIKMIHEL